jgi:hypothetical protein
MLHSVLHQTPSLHFAVNSAMAMVTQFDIANSNVGKLTVLGSLLLHSVSAAQYGSQLNPLKFSQYVDIRLRTNTS